MRFDSILWVLLPLLPLAGRAESVSFSDDIAPLLAAKCQACHGETGGQAGLALTSRANLLRGGHSGPAIIAGQPDESLLLRRISGPEPTMPPAGAPLDAAEVALIRRWVGEGALDDGARGAGKQPLWWSFRPLARPNVPQAGGAWARNEIDRFVASKLEQKGLHATAEAGRATLIRRLTYDLHGLPPTPEEIDAFAADKSPSAYEALVDRLLASPRYGERWGRHWLDVVHYGESHGYDKDKPRRNAWPYRDYVIRSFNGDKPYGQFVEEQLAGDYLHPDDPEGIIATGFIAAGPWDYVGQAELREGTTDKKLARLLDRDDMLAATMSTFTSLTAHCARCHDHKFDPILQADYYALQAVFAGVDRADQPYDDDPKVFHKRRELWFARRDAEAALVPIEQRLSEATNTEIAELDAKSARLADESADLLPKVGEVDTPATIARRNEIAAERKEIGAKRRELAIALLDPASQQKLTQLQAQRAEIDDALAALPEPRLVYSAASYFQRYGQFTPAWEPRPVHLLGRGSVDAPGPLATPGAVAAVPNLTARFALDPAAPEGARRAALAQWITNPENPLTWRSIVNRVWHYHFGAGIVDSPNDFGRMGGQPTHPELLDWLAVEFRDGGGSVKALHRLIVTSATYRQASTFDEANAKLDASNRYLWRMNRHRLEAESVRDSLLAVSGRLDLTMGGPSAEQFFFKDDHSPIYDYSQFDFASPEARRRSVYRFLVRSAQDPFMESLDCADPSLLVPQRSTTLTAIQALALLNDPLVLQESQHFADRLRGHSSSPDEQIDYGFRLALGRHATKEEISAMRQHAEKYGLENAVRLIWNMNEFLFVD